MAGHRKRVARPRKPVRSRTFADCALAGLRVALELLLAAERVRQNGPAEDYVGDRVMEGLTMASLSLTAQVSARMRPEE